jgi:hypothetical protein
VGIPSGLSFARFDAFGMYTRLTARGFQDVMDWCTRTAICALASGVNATSPSIPAVLRPVLRCVTCRTVTRFGIRAASVPEGSRAVWSCLVASWSSSRWRVIPVPNLAGWDDNRK